MPLIWQRSRTVVFRIWSYHLTISTTESPDIASKNIYDDQMSVQFGIDVLCVCSYIVYYAFRVRINLIIKIRIILLRAFCKYVVLNSGALQRQQLLRRQIVPRSVLRLVRVVQRPGSIRGRSRSAAPGQFETRIESTETVVRQQVLEGDGSRRIRVSELLTGLPLYMVMFWWMNEWMNEWHFIWR